jgi:3-phenylpropionate/trans-cinnamate dioxygenase ferredoxin subunit
MVDSQVDPDGSGSTGTGRVRAAASSDVSEGSGIAVDVGGRRLAIFRFQGRLYCIDDTCTHEDESLAEGEIIPEECAVECPKHGSLFSLETGEAITLPATVPVRTYPVEEIDGEIFVEVED